jgi:hypothetical protein
VFAITAGFILVNSPKSPVINFHRHLHGLASRQLASDSGTAARPAVQ